MSNMKLAPAAQPVSYKNHKNEWRIRKYSEASFFLMKFLVIRHFQHTDYL